MSDPAAEFGARSIFGAATRKGLVEVQLGSERMLIVPAKAREIATFLLECAAAAEGDEALVVTCERVGISPTRALQLLLAQRVERDIIQRRARAEARRAMVEDQTDPDAGPDEGLRS